MLDFIFRSSRGKVPQSLGARMNRSFVQQMGDRDRKRQRSAFCEVVWVAPYDEATNAPDFDRISVAVTRDICPDSLSIIHTTSFDSGQILVGFMSEFEPAFIRCNVRHCTPLGYGFFQIGLDAQKLVNVRPEQIEAISARLERAVENAEPVTV